MMKAPSHGRDGAVRALVRGLAVLRQINLLGEARPGEIAAALDLPRPTVYRLLQTLEEEGYVVFSSTNNRVRVTRLAASLGDGSARTSVLCQAAGPLFSEYMPKIVWPLDLSVYESAAMVIQETTHGRSPLSVDKGMVGYRMPVLRTSAGRAYLAFISDEERRLIIEHILRLGHPKDLAFFESTALDGFFEDIRRKGYATREAGEFRPNTSSIAVPVMLDGATIACVSIIWIRSALTIKEAIESYVSPMLEIAGRIADTVRSA
ncbi:DNA-binding transcriptional regulator [Ochrobactrum sp. Q0168]|uniref:DNA-binding transcriptional regulator n=1 Tax=Ochrobactrum sp. Q0168 TaxID=2793241 RepID=UPI0018ED3049|nr:DNA-binding transcriptional regulator [Ochrobactrum sp. Q0168]